MKKWMFALLCACLSLGLTACHGQVPVATATSSPTSAPQVTVTPAPTTAPASSSAAETPAPSLTVLSEEEVDSARRAAMDYYAETVFDVSSLTPLTADTTPFWEGEIVFQAVCSKGGEAQPARTIALERQDGVWTVINEGY